MNFFHIGISIKRYSRVARVTFLVHACLFDNVAFFRSRSGLLWSYPSGSAEMQHMANVINMLEVCVDNLESALSAVEGGASRIELCSSLSEGGLTPSVGFAKLLRQTLDREIPIFAMIRPRGGDFLYSSPELDIMTQDIENMLDVSIDGFVFGCLDEEGSVDHDACSKLLARCRSKPVTFHRAFDVTQDAHAALADICDLGFQRLLTSGQARTAMEGMDLIKSLQEKFGSRIRIMAGGGVNETNVGDLMAKTGVREVHASCKSYRRSKMKFINEKCSMGPDSKDYMLTVTSVLKVEGIVKSLHNVN